MAEKLRSGHTRNEAVDRSIKVDTFSSGKNAQTRVQIRQSSFVSQYSSPVDGYRQLFKLRNCYARLSERVSTWDENSQPHSDVFVDCEAPNFSDLQSPFLPPFAEHKRHGLSLFLWILLVHDSQTKNNTVWLYMHVVCHTIRIRYRTVVDIHCGSYTVRTMDHGTFVHSCKAADGAYIR